MANDLEIFRISNPAAGAGIALSEVLEHHKEQPVLLLLSGGSALSILDYIEVDVLGPNLTITMLDERCSSDPKVNNFLQLKEKIFYKNAVTQNAKIISTAITENDDCAEFAKRWEKEVIAWKKDHPDGVVLATMGMGADGHVAGIFPGVDEKRFNGEELVVSYSVSPEVNKFTDRITVTYTFLKEYIDGAIVYAVGEEKEEVIKMLEEVQKKMRAGDEMVENIKTTKEIPAMVFRQMKLVVVYTGLK